MKTTRSNFTRKALTFGIIVFMSVALVASGFAAWLISGGSNASGTSNVNVETVSSASIKINIDSSLLNENGTLKNEKAAISFAPQIKDQTGYITYTPADGSFAEKLDFNVYGDVTNYDKVGELTFSLKVSDGLVYAAGFRKDSNNAWTYVPEKAYIMLPSYAMDKDGAPLPRLKVNNEGNIVVDGTTSAVKLNTNNSFTSADEAGFTFNVEDGKFNANYKFGWGEAVNSENPGISLDALETAVDKLPNCVKNEQGGYVLKQAELVIRLINVIVNGWEINNTLTNSVGQTILVNLPDGATSINAYDIDVTNLPTTILGTNQTERLQNLIEALEKLEKASTERAQYTVYITATPR